MKKIPKDYRLRQARIIAKRFRRTHKKFTKRHRQISRQRIRAKALKRELLSAPETLAFFPDTTEATIRFINKIRKAIQNQNNVLIDFSATKQLTAAGAVYLHSEIDLLQTQNSASIHIDLQSATGWLRPYLRDCGLLGLTQGGPQPTGQGLPIISGNSDVSIQEITLRVIEFLIAEARFFQQIADGNIAQAQQLAYSAITEALLNVRQHAYPDSSEYHWWLTAAIVNEKLFIALCDRGIGIPKTLAEKGWLGRIKALVTDDDGELIKKAMEYTRTSVADSSGRGLGTQDIQKLILEQKKGRLTIVSGKGHYQLSGENKGTNAATIKDDVNGTVIQWSISLQSAQENNDE